MKPNRRTGLMVLSSALLFCAASGDTAAVRAGGAEREAISRFSRFLEDLRAELRIPGLSAAIVKDGDLVWAAGFGYADLERAIPASPTTGYYLASLTKPFASTIVLQLVERGKLNLNTPVSAFGIRLHSPGVITVRHLLSHTSEGQPGTFYSYNGYRYNFLGQVIERASGRTFRELVTENIIKPLGLTGTAPLPTGDREADLPFADAYRSRTRPYAQDDAGRFVEGQYESGFGAAAGLISTVRDMAAYDIALSDDKLLRPETREMAFTPVVSRNGERLPYGLGWFTEEYQGLRLIWHYGYWGPSESTLILKVPDERLTLIVLANRDALSSPFSLGDGDVLSSPLAAVFLRMFVLPETIGRSPADIDWTSAPQAILARLREEKDERVLALYKREMMAYWAVYRYAGRKEAAQRLLDVNADFYAEDLPAGLRGLPVIAEISGLGDSEYRVVEFTLERDTRVRLYGIGEGTRAGMYDFGGLESLAEGKLVWLMDFEKTVPAGGSSLNRRIDEVITLPRGTYRLHFKTDHGHSPGGWLGFPPDHLFWGIVLYEADSTGLGLAVPAKPLAKPSLKLLNTAITGDRPFVVGPHIVPETLTKICGGIFLVAFVVWPVSAALGVFRRFKARGAGIPRKQAWLTVAATIIAWINVVVGLFYITVAFVRGALRFLLENGFSDEKTGEVTILFLYIPLASALLAVPMICFTLRDWRRRDRGVAGRWFYTLIAAASIVWLPAAFSFYRLLFR